MADVSQELLTIVNGRYGSDIRMAIHDALNKINKSSSGGGGGGGSGPVGTIKHKLGGYDDIITSGFINYQGNSKCDFAQNSSSTPRSTVTVTKQVLGQHVVLGLAMYTGQDLTVSDSSWEHVYGPATLVDNGVKYCVEIFKKTATYETVSFNPTTYDNQILCAKVVVLNRDEDFKSASFGEITSVHQTVQGIANDALYLAVSSEDWNPTFTTDTPDTISMTAGQFCGFYRAGGSGNFVIDYAKPHELPAANAMLVTVILE